MMNDLWILIGGVLVLIGLVTSESLLLIVGSMVVLIWLATKIWNRYAFRRVSHSRYLNRSRAFIGDTVEYSVTLRNDKLLPLIWVDIHDTFPEVLDLPGAGIQPNPMEGTRRHTITTSLLPFQQVTWKYTLVCNTRGYHRIGPARVRSGDIFGFSSGEARFDQMSHLLVYPRVVELEQLNIPAENPLGESKGRRPLIRDTTRFAGQRDYQNTDPMKLIDWKASARASRLQTKLFEPVVSLNVLVALNATTSEQPWQTSNRRLFERAVTVAASIASYASRRGYTFGLVSNAVATFSARYISVPLGASPSQITLVLEALATTGPFTMTSLASVLRDGGRSLPPGSTVVLVTSALTEAVAAEIQEMQGRGYHVVVVNSGDSQSAQGMPGLDIPGLEIPGVQIHHVGDALDALEKDESVLAS